MLMHSYLCLSVCLEYLVAFSSRESDGSALVRNLRTGVQREIKDDLISQTISEGFE
jgi:hypothetical protein